MEDKEQNDALTEDLLDNKIRIEVFIRYVEAEIKTSLWLYNVVIHNQCSGPIKILHRFLKVIDLEGRSLDLSGVGVAGEQIIISKDASFEYVGAIRLVGESGIVLGSYDILDINNTAIFSALIPSFSLDQPGSTERAN